jgi:hypothetical protein
LADRVDRVTQADRRFFERFPHRQHRVRIASQAEIEQQEFELGGVIFAEPWHQIYVAVKNITPGCRLRLMIIGPRDAETDLSEDLAQALYEAKTSDKTREIEAQMRAAMGGAR